MCKQKAALHRGNFFFVALLAAFCAVSDTTNAQTTTPYSTTYSFKAMHSASTVQLVSGSVATSFNYANFRCINDGTTRRSCGGTTPYQVAIPAHSYHGEWDIELTGVDLFQGGSQVGASFTMTDPTACIFKSSSMTISGTSSVLQFTYSQTGATAQSLCKFRIPRLMTSTSNAVVSLAFAKSPEGTPFMDWIRTLQSSTTDDLTYDLQLSFTATLACDATLPDIDIVAAQAANNNVAFGYWKGSTCGSCNDGWLPTSNCAALLTGPTLNTLSRSTTNIFRDTAFVGSTLVVGDSTEAYKEYIVRTTCSTDIGTPVITRSTATETFTTTSAYPVTPGQYKICGKPNAWSTNYIDMGLSFNIVKITAIDFKTSGTLQVLKCSSGTSMMRVTDPATSNVPFSLLVPPVGATCGTYQSGTMEVVAAGSYVTFCSAAIRAASPICLSPSQPNVASASSTDLGLSVLVFDVTLLGTNAVYWPFDRVISSSFTTAVTPAETTISELYFAFSNGLCSQSTAVDSAQVFQISSSTVTPPTTASIYTTPDGNNGVHNLCVSSSYGSAPSTSIGGLTFYSHSTTINFVKVTGINGAMIVNHPHQAAQTYTLNGRWVLDSFLLRLYTDSACTTGQVGPEMALTPSMTFEVTATHAAGTQQGLYLCFVTAQSTVYHSTAVRFNMNVVVSHTLAVAGHSVQLTFTLPSYTSTKFSVSAPTTPSCTGALSPLTQQDAVAMTPSSPFVASLDVCYSHDDGATQSFVQSIPVSIASYTASSALAPSSGRAFVNYALTVTVYGILNTAGFLRLATSSSCDTAINSRGGPIGDRAVASSASPATGIEHLDKMEKSLMKEQNSLNHIWRTTKYMTYVFFGADSTCIFM